DTVVAGVNVSRQRVEKLIRGRRGTALDIHIAREGEELKSPIRVIRDQVTVSSIDVAYVIRPGVGYLKIRRFGINTADEFKRAIVELKKQGASKLILDLRDNGGGYFHVAIKIASEFFNDSRLIVYTKGAHEDRHEYRGEESGEFTDGTIAVLI